MFATPYRINNHDGMPAVSVPQLDCPDPRMLDDVGLTARCWSSAQTAAARAQRLARARAATALLGRGLIIFAHRLRDGILHRGAW